MTPEPLVFIPGFMCDARAFLPQMVQLGASHACQVILPSGEETVERLSEVVLANAYFVPGGRLRRALLQAARRGVRVRVLLQGKYEGFMQYHAAI